MNKYITADVCNLIDKYAYSFIDIKNKKTLKKNIQYKLLCQRVKRLFNGPENYGGKGTRNYGRGNLYTINLDYARNPKKILFNN